MTTTDVDTSKLRETVANRPSGGGGKTVRQIVEEQKPQIARALPSMVDPERFTRVVITELSRNPALAACSGASLLGALMYAAGLGVEPGPLGHCYLVPYGKSCTFILGYKGMIELARRSGQIRDIQAREVREHDEFTYNYGLPDDVLIHRPSMDEDPGPVVMYYALARYKDGGHNFLVMNRAQIEARRARSAAKNSGPWKSDYDAMAKKTVVRALQPFLPLTPEIADAMERDEVRVTFDPDRDPAEALEIVSDIQELDAGPEPLPSEPAPQQEGGQDAGGSVAGVGTLEGTAEPPASVVDEEATIIDVPPEVEDVDSSLFRDLRDVYGEMTVEQLDACLREAELPRTGNRDAKLARIRAWAEEPM